ncbi:MAG: hypothetical protein JHD35_12665 [Sphingopyxis sp.]|nr:hypothetical protein [Sphingopyxis sp.]
MPFDFLDALGIAGDAASGIPDPRNRRERIGCLLGVAAVISVAVILLIASAI